MRTLMSCFVAAEIVEDQTLARSGAHAAARAEAVRLERLRLRVEDLPMAIRRSLQQGMLPSHPGPSSLRKISRATGTRELLSNAFSEAGLTRAPPPRRKRTASRLPAARPSGGSRRSLRARARLGVRTTPRTLPGFTCA